MGEDRQRKEGRSKMNGVFSYLLGTINAASVLWALCSFGGPGSPKPCKAPFGFLPTNRVSGGVSHIVLYISVYVCGDLQSLEAVQSWLHRIRSMFSRLCTSVLVSQIRNWLLCDIKCLNKGSSLCLWSLFFHSRAECSFKSHECRKRRATAIFLTRWLLAFSTCSIKVECAL